MGDDEYAKLQQERNRLQAEIRRIDLAITAKQKPNRVRHKVEMSRSNNGVFALDVGKLDAEKLNASVNYQLDPAPPNTFAAPTPGRGTARIAASTLPSAMSTRGGESSRAAAGRGRQRSGPPTSQI